LRNLKGLFAGRHKISFGLTRALPSEKIMFFARS